MGCFIQYYHCFPLLFENVYIELTQTPIKNFQEKVNSHACLSTFHIWSATSSAFIVRILRVFYLVVCRKIKFLLPAPLFWESKFSNKNWQNDHRFWQLISLLSLATAPLLYCDVKELYTKAPSMKCLIWTFEKKQSTGGLSERVLSVT